MKKMDSDDPIERRFAALLQSETEQWTADCLAPERVIALAERRLPETEAARLLSHVALCSRCRREYAETAELLQLAAEFPAKPPAPQRDLAGAAEAFPLRLPPFLAFWRRALLPASGFALGAAAVGATLYFAFLVPARRQRDVLAVRFTERDAQAAQSERDRNRLARELADLGRKRSDSAELAQETARLKARLKQQNVQMARLSESDLALRQIPLPAAAWRLRSAIGEVRGNAGDGAKPSEIVPVSPVNTAIATALPTLEIHPLSGADRIQVTLETEGANEERPAPRRLSATRWQVAAPLPPGKVYRWAVTAQRNSATIYSPFTTFYVLSASDKREIAAAQQKFQRNPLALGAVYARFGLREEAARQFRAALDANPEEPVAKRWLDELRSRNPVN